MPENLQDSFTYLQTEINKLKRENNSLRHENIALRHTLQTLRTLHEISGSVTKKTDINQFMARLLQLGLEAVSATAGSLLLVDEDTDELGFAVVQGGARGSLVGYRLPLGAGIAGWVAQNKQSLLAPNARLDPRFSEEIDIAFGFETRSILCVPVIYGERIWGALEALNKEEGASFNRDDQLLMEIVSNLIGSAIFKAENLYRKNLNGNHTHP